MADLTAKSSDPKAPAPLVSVIMPAYNSECYIAQAIQSVIDQTEGSWELCITDDCSTDRTREIVGEFCKEDNRVHLYEFEANQGAAAARNNSLTKSTGRLVAYLDADDCWLPTKLRRQTEMMLSEGIGFSCASYEVIDEEGFPKGKEVHMMPELDYMGFLTNNLIQTVGVVVDTAIVDKNLLIMPDLRRRQDAATWLQVLKAGHNCYGIDEVLGQYRRVHNSLSSNKFKAIKGIWYLYREVEHLSLPVSIYCFVRYAFLAVWKRIYRNS